MKITASRLSEGNKVFPSEIHVESTGITIKIPGLFSGESKYFDFVNIASVDIDTPMIGYSTITIYAGGTRMAAHGFTKSEVKQVKQSIEDGKKTHHGVSNGGVGGGNVTTTNITNSGPGFGSLLGKTAHELFTHKAMFEKEKEDRDKLNDKIDDISSLSISGTADDISNTLNKLVSVASTNPDKKIKNAIIEKLEFGILKLRGLNATAEAAFFEKKLEPLKKKSWF